MLQTVNDTRRDYPRQTTVVTLIEEQTRQTPQSRAAACEGASRTYAELGQDVTRLAHHLRSRGIGQGNFVGVCLSRSIDMLTAVLAVMKTGAAYVPLDPNFPRERLEFMAEDAHFAAIVMHAQTENTFSMRGLCIHLDREREEIARAGDAAFYFEPDPLSPAYVLFTSGSTGRPKGVQIPHRALVNMLWSMRSEPGITSHDILLAVTTLSFDIAALELYLPLLVGATVVIATATEARDPRLLSKLLATTGATVMQATPIQWRMLVEEGWKGKPNFKILCGGEPLRPQLAASLVTRGELWNMYGPTETTVWSSVCRIDSADKTITVGFPIANTFFYFLDGEGKQVPAHEKGELYIGGDGVADGYLNRPELTAERFLPDPFRTDEAGRMYRTGDVAVLLGSGATELFGRTDAQVKVRGFRIELGEVESILARCPAVRENAVVTTEEASGELALAAYFVSTPGAIDPEAEVWRFLRDGIPDYMVPAHLVRLEQMPQLPNGKIDRRSLPSLKKVRESDHLVTETVIVNESRDELESKLLAIWEAVLDVPRLNKHSNFFEVGGRSLLAARLFTQIAKQLGKTLPLATLFQAPTVIELAAVIRDSGWTPPWGSLVPIQPYGSKPPIFFVHAIGGNIINFQAFASRFDSDQPIYGLQARGLDGKEEPHHSVENMATDYIRSIRSVQGSGPYRLGGFSAGGIVAFEMARQLLESGEETSLLAFLDSQIMVRGSANNMLRRWGRVLMFNLRSVVRTGLRAFISNKLRNWRMRARIRATAMGLGSLNAEEAFLLALRQYKPDPFDGTAVLFRAKHELTRNQDPTFGWRRLILGELQVVEVAGDHDTLLDEPNIGELAHELDRLLRNSAQEQEAVL